MDQAPTPGGAAKVALNYEIKDPKRLRGLKDKGHQALFKAGVQFFSVGDHESALNSWIDIGPTDESAVNYNRAVGYLIKASGLTQSDPGAAYEQVDKAYQDLFLSAQDYAETDAALFEQVRNLRDGLKEYEGVHEAVVATQPTSTPSTDVSAPKKTGSKFALLIGIGQFEDGNVNPLSAAPRDVDTMKSSLKAAGFKDENIYSLVDTEATLQGIRNAINEIGQKVDDDSLLVVSISSHGSSPSDNDPLYKEGFIFCHDSNLDQLFATAYPIIDFREHLDRRIRCQQKIIFQDTCHSGAGSSRLTGTRIEFVQWPDYMAIFAAAGENQVSVETDGNGIFTKSLADYITAKKGKVTVSEINDHLTSSVPAMAGKLNFKQNPQVFLGAGAGQISLN